MFPSQLQRCGCACFSLLIVLHVSDNRTQRGQSLVRASLVLRYALGVVVVGGHFVPELGEDVVPVLRSWLYGAEDLEYVLGADEGAEGWEGEASGGSGLVERHGDWVWWVGWGKMMMKKLGWRKMESMAWI